MKKALSAILAFALCLSLFAGTGLTAAADEAIDRYLNVTGGELVFTNDPQYPWAYDSISIGKYGASAGNSGVDSSSSTVSTVVTFAEGEGICFTWRASSQQKWDYMAFLVDGEEIARISGSFGPETRVFPVAAGEHVLAWTYVKDEAYGIYNDRGYLDEVHVVAVSANADNIDSALNVTDGGLVFENDAAEPWTAYERTSGSFVGRSGNAGKSASESAVSLSLAMDEGETLRFTWGVSSEKDHDFLVFEVNGEEYASISGEVAPNISVSYTAQAAGDYDFRWVYRKDTLNDYGDDCGYLYRVRTEEYIPLTGVMIVKSTTVSVGKPLRLTYTTKPTNATKKQVTWASDNEQVAVVSEDGTVTGITAGTANITVTTVDGGFSATCALTVAEFTPDVSLYVNAANGKDSANGTSASSAVRSLSKLYELIYKNVPLGGSAKVYVTGTLAASEELRVFDREINVVSASGTAVITRASGYRGPLFRVAAGGVLRLGNTSVSGEPLTVGNSAADAPCLLIDGGEAVVYPSATIAENRSSVSGAGVYVKSGRLAVEGGGIVSNISARYGGGIYAESGSVTVNGGVVSANRAGIYGGGAYLSAGTDCVIDESAFGGNTAGEDFNEICYGEPPAAPEVTGVEDGAEYDFEVSASWESFASAPASATLNGEPYEAGTPISEPGEYVLTVTDGYSVVTVSFRIVEHHESVFRALAFLSDNAAGETGWAAFDMNGNEEPARYAVPEKPVAAATYLAGKIYGYSEDGYFFTIDVDEELPVGALFGANMVWSDEPVFTDYCVLDMTYDYWGRDMVVLVADDANARYVAVVNRDGTVDQLIPVFDADDTETSPLLMTIACSADGVYYAVSGGENAAFWMLTGADEHGGYVSKLFDIGGEAYYLQSMAFDLESNTLYWAQCGMERSGLYRVDIEDEFLGYCGSPLGDDAELTALMFLFDVDTEAVCDSEDGRFKYSYLPEGGVEIVGYNFRNENGEPLFEEYEDGTFLVEVPEQIDGMDVLSIGKYAFRDRSVGEDPDAYMQIGKVVFTETLETIGYGAFRGCVSLKEIEFGGQEHEIGDYAFYQCRSLTDVFLPWPLETIGYGAFSECTALEKATVTGPTEDFGGYIFYNVPESFELWGQWPSATYDYAIANNLTFRDIEPYEPPVVYGVEDGEKVVLADRPDGCAIDWSAKVVRYATLDGEPYEEGTPVTALGDHVFAVSDGRTEVTVSFRIVETGYKKGDFDGDGRITVADALAALRIAARLAEEDAISVEIGDTDHDGKITVADALAILRVAARLADESSLG